MKIFTSENSTWNEKINFVDSNNLFVGYDMAQDCCESFGWFISKSISPKVIKEIFSEPVDNYSFDKYFFAEIKCDTELEDGSMVIFRLVCKDSDDLYLHLYNCHNGYYSHGFEFKKGDKILRDGRL